MTDHEIIAEACDHAGAFPALYTSDGNALEAATHKILNQKAHHSAITDAWYKYRDFLAQVVGCAWYQSTNLLRATIAQRARALALTIQWIKDHPDEA